MNLTLFQAPHVQIYIITHYFMSVYAERTYLVVGFGIIVALIDNVLDEWVLDIIDKEVVLFYEIEIRF